MKKLNKEINFEKTYEIDAKKFAEYKHLLGETGLAFGYGLGKLETAETAILKFNMQNIVNDSVGDSVEHPIAMFYAAGQSWTCSWLIQKNEVGITAINKAYECKKEYDIKSGGLK